MTSRLTQRIASYIFRHTHRPTPELATFLTLVDPAAHECHHTATSHLALDGDTCNGHIVSECCAHCCTRGLGIPDANLYPNRPRHSHTGEQGYCQICIPQCTACHRQIYFDGTSWTHFSTISCGPTVAHGIDHERHWAAWPVLHQDLRTYINAIGGYRHPIHE